MTAEPAATVTDASKTLRRAAALLRERASAATSGPWTYNTDDPERVAVDAPPGRALVDVLLGSTDTREHYPQATADAEYVALMHPPVALLLAAVLDTTAEEYEGVPSLTLADQMYAADLALARAILRESADQQVTVTA